MAENTGEAQETEKLFTQADVDRIVGERLKRAKADVPSDYEDIKKSLEAMGGEVKELKKAKAEAEAKAKALEEEQERQKTLKAISEETGIPASLIRGANEDEMRQHATALAQFKGAPSGIAVGGSTKPNAPASAIDAFDKFMRENFQ